LNGAIKHAAAKYFMPLQTMSKELADHYSLTKEADFIIVEHDRNAEPHNKAVLTIRYDM
jgi:hypothetical protein